MRLSKSGWVTFKEVPKEAEVISHQLQLRAGLIHKISGGIYNYMPFAVRILRKIKEIVRQEMDSIDCQEITMSVVTPSELWKETKRWDIMGPLMARFKDRSEKELCISPTNEETVTDIFRSFIHSYKQLPITYYQINTKFRDEIRPRFGLMRGREFIMKDGYSFHLDKQCLDIFYNKIYKAYENIFKRMGLTFIAVEADGGAMATSDSKTHEFQVIAENGEDKLIFCPTTGWGANIEKANTKKVKLSFKKENLSLEKISTVLSQYTMEEAAHVLGLPLHQCLKSVCCRVVKNGEVKIVLALLLGDDDLNEIKLKNLTAADELIPANEEDLKRCNLVKGYIGPLNLKSEVSIYVDSEISQDYFYAIGANEKNYHFVNFNLKRDLKSDFQHVDLRLSKEGDMTRDGNPVVVKKGIEVGHIFQLGDKYTKAMNVTVLDNAGKHVTPLMGCYGIGVSRLMSAAIEQHFDQSGIIWPISIAPFHIYLCRLAKTDENKKIADEIYAELEKSGFEVLYDDRDFSPGIMFKDADLLGLPIRILFGERDYNADKTLEVKIRSTGEIKKINKENLIYEINEIMNQLYKKCSI